MGAGVPVAAIANVAEVSTLALALTGCAVMINTSFNIRGEPIVCTAMDAYRCFMGTEIDALVIGRYLLLKADQPVGNRPDHAEYLAGYRND